MTYLLAALAGVAAAVVGYLISAGLGAWIAGLCGMSDFEGGRGMFAAFVVGPIGGVASMVAAVWWALRRGRGAAPLGASLGRVALVLTAIAVAVGTAIAIRLATLDTYTNEAPPTLEFQVRVPGGMPVPDPSTLRIELHTAKNVGAALLDDRWIPVENDRNQLSGSVPLAIKTSSRLLVVPLPDQPTRLFRLALARDPASSALGAWQRPDHVDVPGEPQPRPAPADDPVELRYRVRRAGDD